MKIKLHIIIILFGMFIFPGTHLAQEKESAEISLEAYSDAFQEHFFGALKEKAVENYEKAINLLLECKNIQPENVVVDYELGKNHLALGKYYEAERYIKNALAKEPGNIWYKEALFNVYSASNNTAKAIATGKQLAREHSKYKERLIQLYARTRNYKEAIVLLDELDAAQGISSRRKRQRTRYQSMLTVTGTKSTPVENQTSNPLTAIDSKINNYQKVLDYKGLLTYVDEVLETYPAQSKFYYIKGKALNQLKKHTEATTVLETALDFLVDDSVLKSNIYKELVLAYQAKGNTKKVQEYSKKLKNRT